MLRRLLGPLASRWAWVETAIRVQERFGEIHGGYVAAALTLAAFLSLFPLLLVAVGVIGWLSAGDPDLSSSVIERLGLTGEASTAVVSAIRQAEQSRRAASVLGLVGLLWSGLGVVAAMQYAVDTAWQVSGRGLRDKLFGLAWLAGAGVVFIASLALTAVINLLPGAFAPVSIALGLAVDVGLWMWTLKVLANRDVGWRPLLPGAVFGAVALEVLKVVGSLYVPRAVASSAALYGSIGVVFAILAWLFLFGRVVVYAATLNVVRWEEDHGTVRAEIELPHLPGAVSVEATRSGEAVDIRDRASTQP